MASPVSEFTSHPSADDQPVLNERRRYQRIKLSLLGRFMRENKQEYPCKVMNISPGGAALLAPISGEINEKIIAYIDHIGRIEGIISRPIDGGFAMKIMATAHKREKIADQLTWLANRRFLGLPEERRHERIVPRTSVSHLKFEDGRTKECQILDVSLSGASVALEDRPPLGENIMLGRMRGRIVRYHDTGVAIEFLDIQNPSALSNYFC